MYFKYFYGNRIQVTIRARSVLAETEEPTVLTQILRTETEIEPIFAKFQNRERIGTEIIEPWVSEVFFETIFP